MPAAAKRAVVSLVAKVCLQGQYARLHLGFSFPRMPHLAGALRVAGGSKALFDVPAHSLSLADGRCRKRGLTLTLA